MREVAVVIAPFMIMWLLVIAPSVITRSGRTSIRWRAIKNRLTHQEDGHVDVSAAAAASIIANRLKLLTDFALLLVIIYMAFALELPTFVAIGILLVLAAVAPNGYLLPALIYRSIAGHTSFTLRPNAFRYYILAERSAYLRTLRRLFPGQLLMMLGFVLLTSAGFSWAYNSDAIVSGLPGLSLRHSGPSPHLVPAVTFTEGGLALWIGTYFDRRRRRREMTAITDLGRASTDKEATTVFLRQFGTEVLRIPCHASPRFFPFWQGLVPRRSAFLEDAVTWPCWTFGHAVSISDPRGAQERTLGAARHDAPKDQDWRDVVKGLVAGAQLVVLICGKGQGIREETTMILERKDWAAKTFFLNVTPTQPVNFLRELELANDGAFLPAPKGKALIGAVVRNGQVRYVWSSLAEDVDYESGIQWLARERGLLTDPGQR